ncbi:receptor kinase-like protein Xa21 [Prosopis cineraria]|uniref:receptor kinase-like protein Xa21 n=1 Tax=Prosopis cineraria TaxID=364024 RepID=UPI00240E9E86|nr:receptor kinase-like protein Xa21 [Prosopis cineraria]
MTVQDQHVVEIGEGSKLCSATQIRKMETRNRNIPNEISNLTSVSCIYASANQLSGHIPRGIGKFTRLQELFLDNNNLEGNIPNEIISLANLKMMSLRVNQPSGPIPRGIGNLTVLQQLYLDSNNLEGSIPMEIGNLQQLQILDLSQNKFRGFIPSEIFNMSTLEVLSLSNNSPSRSLPSNFGFGGLSNLQRFYLWGNKLFGKIPNTISHASKLTALELDNNNFEGVLPNTLGHLRYLETFSNAIGILEVNLSSNVLVGNLSFKIGNLTALISLDLSINRISGIIPSVIGGLQNLQILSLAHNKLHRKIPESLGNSPSLVKFDESNLLGRESFGSVFKGKLSSGIMVAIKIFNFDSEALSRSFEVECDAMCNLCHQNLVKIICSCSNADLKCLIMEFIPNGSLEKWLYFDNYHLDFLQRLNIMINVAFPSEYLHHDLSTPVVHCDLKPSNILLDDNMVAHVSDFGIAQSLDKGKSKMHTEIISTIGYIAPGSN